MKKYLIIIISVYFSILLIVPCYIIYNHYDILSTGEVYKIKVTGYDPYDPFRGRYVSIRPELPAIRRPVRCVRLSKDEDGFVYDTSNSTDTNAAGYVKILKIERYYMNEGKAPLVDRALSRWDGQDELVYVVIKVKNGSYAIEGLYINGIPAEDYAND